VSRILEPIEPRQVALWGQHTVRLRHTLAARELFSDDSIAGLIDTVDPAHMKIENTVRSVATEGVEYHDWFDEYADVHDMEHGDLLHWALNGPHRMANRDTLSVSLTTEHWTPEVRRSYAMNYGNGLLRTVGRWRASGMQRGQRYHWVPGHRIDLDAPNCVRPIVQPPAARTSG
jgi:hypothetical protein